MQKKKGGKILVGGNRINERFFEATVVENSPKDCEMTNEEVFAPVCTLEKFNHFKDVIEKVNDTRFGLQTGLFTKDVDRMFYAYENVDAGAVVINDIPSVRVDSQPYGGIKASGVGREGVRFAIEEFSEMKLLLLKDIGGENKI